MVLRLTSDLNLATNDTGRAVYCGPTVVAAVTGMPVSRIEAEIWRHRRPDEAASIDPTACKPRGKAVTGTDDAEVRAALAAYGYDMVLVTDYKHLELKARPTLWQWMQRPRNAWSHYILGVHKGRQGHWIVVKGVMMCDTYTSGAWCFVVDGPHKGVRLMDVHMVRKAGQAGGVRAPA
jgi:hypothetical protein